jgi:hypothetical protein
MRTKALYDYFDPKKRRQKRLSEASTPQDARTMLVNEAERKLLEKAATRGGRCFRGGWPDFLLELPGKRPVGVEVKRGSDTISDRQAKMFAALERVGLRVMVWNPARPDRLFPWRSYLEHGVREMPEKLRELAEG